MTSSVELTQDLVRLRTINPPGDERACAERLASLLEGEGFAVDLTPFGEGRAQLVARIGGASGKPAIGFTGHLDTVSLGAQPWSVDPLAAEIKDGKLYGRGSSDMKSGVAAFVAAGVALAGKLAKTPGVVMYITAGEETGCTGAAAMAREISLPRVGALVVAEPTGNQPLVGHKGALWLEAVTTGVTAHGSMPEKGVNASVLTPAIGSPPTAIIGPGELALAHQTDEYCLVSRIEQATEIYPRMIRSWCGI